MSGIRPDPHVTSVVPPVPPPVVPLDTSKGACPTGFFCVEKDYVIHLGVAISIAVVFLTIVYLVLRGSVEWIVAQWRFLRHVGKVDEQETTPHEEAEPEVRFRGGK